MLLTKKKVNINTKQCINYYINRFDNVRNTFLVLFDRAVINVTVNYNN